MKVCIRILSPMHLLASKKVMEGEPREILESIETRLEDLYPKWTLEIEVIEV